MTAAEAKLEVEPLLCPNCSGAVPLTDGNAAPCPYCGASVPIPESYRKLRDANRVAEADRARVEAAYARLGTEPGALLRFWAGTASGWWRMMRHLWLIPIALCVILLLPLLLMMFCLDPLAPKWGFNVIDVLGFPLFCVFLAAVLDLLLIVPLILVDYRDRISQCRYGLGAALAAKPPARPGGPVQCRQCGAPLVVPAGALGVRCAYCGTDNLVALSREWIERAASESSGQHQTVLGALEEEEKVVTDARGDRDAYWLLATLLMALMAFAWWGFGHHSYPSGWRHAVTQSPRSVLRDFGASSQRELPVGRIQKLQSDPNGGPYWYVALRKGERFSVISKDLPRDEKLHVESSSGGYESNLSFQYSSKTNEMIGEIEAPYGGWFVVHFRLGSAPSRAPFEVRFTIQPGGR